MSWQNSLWVDFGGTGVDIHDGFALDAWRDTVSMTVTVPFDASRGGLYYCFGWFSVSGLAGGFAACNVDIAAIMNPQLQRVDPRQVTFPVAIHDAHRLRELVAGPVGESVDGVRRPGKDAPMQPERLAARL